MRIFFFVGAQFPEIQKNILNLFLRYTWTEILYSNCETYAEICLILFDYINLGWQTMIDLQIYVLNFHYYLAIFWTKFNRVWQKIQ